MNTNSLYNIGVTGNVLETETALAKPLTLFAKGLDDWGNLYEVAVGEEEVRP